MMSIHFNNLKSKALLATYVVFCGFSGSFAQKSPEKFAQTIKADDLKKHLTFIASDSLKGRETGTAEQKVAAQYIAAHFDACGLKGIVGKDSSHFQSVDLVKRGWGDFYVKAGSKKYHYLEDFIASSTASFSKEEKTSLVFAGYGIEDGAIQHYKDLDVAGKFVIILDGEPRNADSTFSVSGIKTPSKWGLSGGWKEKMYLAQRKGAIGLFIISTTSTEEFQKLVKQRQVMLRRFGNARFGFRAEGEPQIANFATLNISQAMASDLLKTSKETLDSLINPSTRTLVKSSFSPEALSLKIERVTTPVETYNVLGYLEGTDKKEEVLVISSHYDHIGITDGQINNGADDDGSGTVSVLELAQAFGEAAKAGNRPRRSILFITVTGEEKGLLGSEYYVNNPIIPLKQTICDLNIDMVGRTDDAHKKSKDYVYVIGSDKLSSELHESLLKANKQYTKMDLDFQFNDPHDSNRFYYRSDHYNFAKNGIPVAFFFNGVHEDYHRPTDDVEKIEFNKLEKRAKLVFYLAWDLANRDKRIVVDSNKE